MTGRIHSFESLAAVDGEGLRCAVFLAGCPLRCAYCHNPDTRTDPGRETTPAETARKIARFKPYFGADGGATFSGGEPLLQAPFLAETIALLKEEGIGSVIDTSGAVKLTPAVRAALAGAQEILLDLKFWDDASYRRYTGGGIAQVLATLQYLEETDKPTVIRIVIVPGINDSVEVLSRYLPHLAGLRCVKRVELLPFHTLGFFKYEELGIENPLAGTPALDPARCRELQDFFDRKRKENG